MDFTKPSFRSLLLLRLSALQLDILPRTQTPSITPPTLRFTSPFQIPFSSNLQKSQPPSRIKSGPPMDSLSSVSPSFVLPSRHPLCSRRRRISASFGDLRYPMPRVRAFFGPRSGKLREIFCRVGGGGANKGDSDGEDGTEDVDMERALSLDGSIPGTSDEFVKRVSSRAYDMRRHLHQTFDSSSYDVLEANPWRESSKPVYVLTHNENQICTMKTRRSRSEVENELGLLFSKGGKWRSENQKKHSKTGIKFQMLVEDIREGVLVFEDENEAARYCDLLQGGGKGCEGVFEIEASSVFDLCKKMRALAVLFRRGRTPPLPQSLELNLKARKRSLEDQDELI